MKDKRLIIVGASGHGKVVADIAVLNGYTDIVFLDDDESLTKCAGWPVIGNSSEAPEGEVFIAVGNPTIRERLLDRYSDREVPVLIHPNAVIARDVQIGEGTVVMAGAIINSGSIVGKGVIVNTSSSIDHDCFVGDYTHIAVDAHLCGTVNLGNRVWVGAGAIVINNIDICRECIIGAGAVVVNNIEEIGTYVGIPAKKN